MASVSTEDSQKQQKKYAMSVMDLMGDGDDGYLVVPSSPDSPILPINRGAKSGPNSPDPMGIGMTTCPSLQRMGSPAVDEFQRGGSILASMGNLSKVYQQLSEPEGLLSNLVAELPSGLLESELLARLLSLTTIISGPTGMATVDIPGPDEESPFVKLLHDLGLVHSDREVGLENSSQTASEIDLRKHLQLLADDIKQPSHVRKTLQSMGVAHDAEGVRRIGAGDYGANAGRVLVYSQDQELRWVHVPGEELEQETYWAIVWWRHADTRTVTMEQVRFNRYALNSRDRILHQNGPDWRGIGDEILWVATGRPLAFAFKPVSHAETVLLSNDYRHDFRLPMIKLPDGSTGWLGEAALHNSKAKLRAAASSAIQIDEAELIVDLKDAEKALEADGYRKVTQPLEPICPRQYRIHESRRCLELFYAKQTYPASALYVTEGRLYAAAWKGEDGQTIYGNERGYTLDEFAAALVELGAESAMLVDEGADVFHHDGDGYILAPGRPKMRCVFIGIPLQLLSTEKLLPR